MFNFEKHIKNFYKKITECKNCNSKKGLKRYYDSKDKTSNQRKVYYDKILKKITTTKIDIYNLKT